MMWPGIFLWLGGTFAPRDFDGFSGREATATDYRGTPPWQ